MILREIGNMNEQEILVALKQLFPQASISEADGSCFWFVESDERKMVPFMTLVTTDNYDGASNLSREGIYRLNFNLTPEMYRTHFGPTPKARADWGILDTGFDYAALDVLMPHPIYASMAWACILNPSSESFNKLKPLLKVTYDHAAK